MTKPRTNKEVRRSQNRTARRIRWSGPLKKKLFENKAHGGVLRRVRKGRGARFVACQHSMHLVIRSSRAVGPWSFRREGNRNKIRSIIKRFAHKYEVVVHSYSIPDNHVHMHLQFCSKKAYKAFIRAVTSAIAMAITKVSRWNKEALEPSKWQEVQHRRFWDHRPFTKIVYGVRQFLSLKNYLDINAIEGLGFSKPTARWLFAHKKDWVKLKLAEQMNS